MDGLRISELAARSGVAATTLRFWESEGLLTAERGANGYRRYGEADVERLAFISQAKALDLPLADIRDLVTAWESQPCSGVRAAYRPILTARAREIDARVAALSALRATLASAVDVLDALPDRGSRCDPGCAFLATDPPAAPPPIACTLDDAGDHAERIAAWHHLLAGVATEVDSTHARVVLPIERLAVAAELAAAEQRCCAFLGFGFELHGSVFELTITAPPEAIGMLAELIPNAGTTGRDS